MSEVLEEEITKICRQWAWDIRNEAEALGFDTAKRLHVLRETGRALMELAELEEEGKA